MTSAGRPSLSTRKKVVPLKRKKQSSQKKRSDNSAKEKAPTSEGSSNSPNENPNRHRGSESQFPRGKEKKRNRDNLSKMGGKKTIAANLELWRTPYKGKSLPSADIQEMLRKEKKKEFDKVTSPRSKKKDARNAGRWT